MNEKNKSKYIMDSKNKQNGITLISLVITIIIMLILAGVAISIAVDPEGLFGRAENATEQWDAKITEEQGKVDEVLGYLGIEPVTEISDQMPEGKGWDNSATGPIDKVATQSGKIAPIPKGYTVSQVPGEGSIKGGMVVYQIPTGATVDWAENEITLSGASKPINLQENVNQYVWIPVDDINDMVMCKSNGSNKKIDGETATDGEKTTCELDYNVTKPNEIACKVHGYDSSITLTDSNIDITGLAGRLYATDTNTSTKPYTTSMAFTEESKVAHRFSTTETYREPDLVTSEDNSNYQLVLKEGTSQALGSANALKQQLNNKFIEMAKSVAKYGGFYISRYEPNYMNNKVISKKNEAVLTAAAMPSGIYNAGDKWYGLYNKTLNNVEKDESVNSHMIWGCQYDQVIKFLGTEAQTGHNYQTTSQVVTGYSADQELNNIYDLEGNNYEWTAQANNTNNRVHRGNDFSTARGNRFYPASHCDGSNPTYLFDSHTTRPTLYIAL